MNQPCQHCIRGLVPGTNELCEPCKATGFVIEKEGVVELPKAEVKVKKTKKVTKKK